MKHRAGGKFAGSHTTVIDGALRVVDRAVKLDEISKIVLGIITSAPSKKARIKFKEIRAGLEVTVYGPQAFQVIYVYTSNPVSTQQALYKAFTW